MKTLSSPHTWGVKKLVASFAILGCVSAFGQNLLSNGDFEQPLGPNNWVVRYLFGGPDDFQIQDRSRFGASGGSGNFYGGTFRPLSIRKPCHAYFGQTITNLTPAHLYTVSGKMREDWWRGDQGTGYKPDEDGKRDKFVVYIEAIGGQGTPMPDGRFSQVCTNPAPIYQGFPDLIYYATDTWTTYSVKQTPATNGTIEIRLHYNKFGFITYDKPWLMPAGFDNISVTP